jgi:hypothetical protein
MKIHNPSFLLDMGQFFKIKVLPEKNFWEFLSIGSDNVFRGEATRDKKLNPPY